MRASSVLVAGSAKLDFVVSAASIPVPGLTALGRDFTFCGVRVAALHRAEPMAELLARARALLQD